MTERKGVRLSKVDSALPMRDCGVVMNASDSEDIECCICPETKGLELVGNDGSGVSPEGDCYLCANCRKIAESDCGVDWRKLFALNGETTELFGSWLHMWIFGKRDNFEIALEFARHDLGRGD